MEPNLIKIQDKDKDKDKDKEFQLLLNEMKKRVRDEENQSRIRNMGNDCAR